MEGFGMRWSGVVWGKRYEWKNWPTNQFSMNFYLRELVMWSDDCWKLHLKYMIVLMSYWWLQASVWGPEANDCFYLSLSLKSISFSQHFYDFWTWNFGKLYKNVKDSYELILAFSYKKIYGWSWRMGLFEYWVTGEIAWNGLKFKPFINPKAFWYSHFAFWLCAGGIWMIFCL